MAFVDVAYRRTRGISTLAPHFPQLNALCHRAGMAWSNPQSGHDAKMIWAKQPKHMYWIESSLTWVDIRQSGQVRYAMSQT